MEYVEKEVKDKGGGDYQEQDLWLSDQSQGCREFPACSTAVAFTDDLSVVVQFQLLQEIVHHLRCRISRYYQILRISTF